MIWEATSLANISVTSLRSHSLADLTRAQQSALLEIVLAVLVVVSQLHYTDLPTTVVRSVMWILAVYKVGWNSTTASVVLILPD